MDKVSDNCNTKLDTQENYCNINEEIRPGSTQNAADVTLRTLFDLHATLDVQFALNDAQPVIMNDVNLKASSNDCAFENKIQQADKQENLDSETSFVEYFLKEVVYIDIFRYE